MTTSTFVERRRLCARLALALSTVLCSGLAAPAFASTPHPNLDANGVDLTDGTFNPSLPIYTIGSGQAELPLVLTPTNGNNGLDNWSGIQTYQTVVGSVTTISVFLGNTFDTFTSADGFAVSKRGTGATLTASGSSAVYHTLEGVTITFYNPNPAGFGGGTTNFCNDTATTYCTLLPSSIDGKAGLTVAYNWDVNPNCTSPQTPDTDGNCNEYWRLRAVSNDAGYGITWAYVNETGPQVAAYFRKSSAAFSNANVSGSPPVATYGYPSSSVTTVTTPGGKVWRFTATSGAITGIRRPSALSDTTVASYDSNGAISAVTNNGIVTNYARTLAGSTATMVVTDAQSHATTIVSDMTKFRPTSITDALGRVTTLTYDSVGKLTEISYPEGNKKQFGYDAASRTTSITLKAKIGSGLSDIVTSTSFGSSCTDATCPAWSKDALRNQTDYVYDGTTGLVTTVTAPAPTPGATRPQTRYGYTAVSGALLVTSVSRCRTGTAPSCVGTSDEVKTTASYNANLLPTSVITGAGDASLTATTAATYDIAGNLLTVDGPLSGTADTTTFRYDVDRNRVGVISADPDGAGALKRRAVKTTYNGDGQPILTELGNVNGTSDGDWAAFVTAQQSTASYDANARKTKDIVTAAGTTYSVTQYSYDAVGRLECSALRMNSAAWGALPSSACTLGTTGSAGPDRVSKTTFDAAGQVTKVQSAYGTADQSDEATGSYNGNGTLATLTDAQSNKTTYEYDGFDRLSKTRYPVTTAGSGTSSTTDYEQLSYDAGSNVTSRRLRDATSIGYGYDALNRVTVKDLPTGEYDVSYSYDLLGRPLVISRPDGATDTITWDALGRMTGDGQPFGSLSWQYDLAGRRTRTTWSDGFYVTYDYDVTGNMTAIRENGASSGIGVLASFGYDDLGQRTSLTRGNGTSTTYTPDPVSRLSSFTNDLAGTNADITASFSYNPASQIASTTRTNDGYAWAGAVNRNDASAVNGLNQTLTVGAGSLGYDSRGNVSSTGSTTFGYTAENRLSSTNTGASLYYDALGRLVEYDTSVSTRFTYDGDGIAAEIENPSGAILKRYVRGPRNDEVLVEYSRSGGGYTRAWNHADERGSIIAQSNDSGTATAVNTYDEYGVPGSSNVGRFGYTGQAWLPSPGVWYYKARMYSARLGRFLQTDPIGYGNGMNWYGYVGGDPVNSTDPSGLEDDDIVVNGKKPNTPTPGFCDQNPFSQFCGGGGGFSSPGGGGLNVPGDGGGTSGPDIVVTGKRPQKKSEPSTLGCIGSALWENKTGLALDTLGWIANAVVPEASVGPAVVGAVLGVAGIAGATIDHTGPADAVVAGSLAYVGKQAAVGEGLLTGAASQLAHRIGVRALLASSLYDGAKTINRFTNCKRGE